MTKLTKFAIVELNSQTNILANLQSIELGIKIASTKVFKDSNRTTRLPFENMTLVVTRKDNGGARLRLIQSGKTPSKGRWPSMKTDFFLDAAEVTDLLELLYA